MSLLDHYWIYPNTRKIWLQFNNEAISKGCEIYLNNRCPAHTHGRYERQNSVNERSVQPTNGLHESLVQMTNDAMFLTLHQVSSFGWGRA